MDIFDSFIDAIPIPITVVEIVQTEFFLITIVYIRDEFLLICSIITNYTMFMILSVSTRLWDHCNEYDHSKAFGLYQNEYIK